MKFKQRYPGIMFVIIGFLVINLIIFFFLRSGGVGANDLLTLKTEKKQARQMVYYVHDNQLVGEEKNYIPESDNEFENILKAYVTDCGHLILVCIFQHDYFQLLRTQAGDAQATGKTK